MVRTPRKRSLVTLRADLIAVAKLTGVAYCENTLERVLNTFEKGFLNHSIQIRSTTKPLDKRDLCFRFLDLESREHPLEHALRKGEVSPNGHEIYDWLPTLAEHFPALGYGVDFEATRGLTKIWQFIDGAYNPEALQALPIMPRGYSASLPLLRELGLDSLTIVGADYVHNSVNLYFRPSQASHHTGALVSTACERLGFAPPSVTAKVHASKTGCIAVTYGWQSPSIDRICFYVAGFSREDVPAYDPLLRNYARNVPALVDDPRFIVGWSHGPRGTYLKIEDDYTGDVSNIFETAMAVPTIEFGDWEPPAKDQPPHEGRRTLS